MELYLQLLDPVMGQVGEESASDTWSTLLEHRATSAAFRLASRIGPRGLHPGRWRWATVVLRAPGDPRQLPVLMFADALRLEGWERSISARTCRSSRSSTAPLLRANRWRWVSRSAWNITGERWPGCS